MSNVPPFSSFYVKTFTATADDAFRIEDNPNIVLKSCNIHCYTNDTYYGNSSAVPGIIRANAVIWFESPIRPFDLLFKNVTAGNNTTVVIVGCLA
jgi:hypothetical protein